MIVPRFSKCNLSPPLGLVFLQNGVQVEANLKIDHADVHMLLIFIILSLVLRITGTMFDVMLPFEYTANLDHLLTQHNQKF